MQGRSKRNTVQATAAANAPAVSRQTQPHSLARKTQEYTKKPEQSYSLSLPGPNLMTFVSARAPTQGAGYAQAVAGGADADERYEDSIENANNAEHPAERFQTDGGLTVLTANLLAQPEIINYILLVAI